MVSSYTTNSKFEKPAAGDYAGGWSGMANNDYDLIDQAITAITSITIAGSNVTLTSNNGAVDEARSATLVIKGSPASQLSVLVPNTLQKNYAVRSKISTAFNVVINNAAQVGAGVTCAPSEAFYFNTDGVRCRKLGVVPKGTIMFWPGTTANIPAGWAVFSTADGKVLSAQSSVGNYPGTNSSVSIGTAGAHDHTGSSGATILTLSQIPSHAHSSAYQSFSAGFTGGGVTLDRLVSVAGATTATTSVGGDGSHLHTISSDGTHTHPIGITVGNPDTYGLILIRKVT